MKTGKVQLVKVIRKQEPISTRCLDLHPAFRVKRNCKECRITK